MFYAKIWEKTDWEGPSGFRLGDTTVNSSLFILEEQCIHSSSQAITFNWITFSFAEEHYF